MVVIRGLSEFTRALAVANAQAADDFKHVLEDVAKPMALHATALEMRGIRRMSMAWADNRVWVGTKAVAVAPRRRGVKARGPDPRRRPNLGRLIISRGYEPTAAQYAPRVRADIERALDRIAYSIEAST
jgi:hypothetical protein